jgi:hypothetical protein
VWEPPAADLAPAQISALAAAEAADAPTAAAAAVLAGADAGEEDESDDDDDNDEAAAAVAVAAADSDDDEEGGSATRASAAAAGGGTPELVSAAIRLADASRSRVVPLNTAKMLHRVALDPSGALPHVALLPEDCLELYDAIVAQLSQERALATAPVFVAELERLLRLAASLDPDVYFAEVRGWDG